MKISIQLLLLTLLPATVAAQVPAEPDYTGAEKPLPVLMVEMGFEDVSFFVQTPTTSILKLPKPVNYPSVRLLGPGPFRLLDYTAVPATGNTGPLLQVRWYPLAEGLETFPAIEVVTDDAVYRTSPSQVLVKSPVKSDTISLEFIPAKLSVYAGEPLRIDVIWRCGISSKRVRSLECYPSFLSDPEIEISIPRTTEPESVQLGLPFGGRRIIGSRELDASEPQNLGTVRFPVYVRFPQPGTFTIESTRLLCAQLQQDGGPLAPYAAYYNNGLFERVEKGVGYDLVYTDSKPVSIDVLPLPEQGRTETFSGIFLPCEISAQVNPDEGNVGGLMDLDIILKTPVSGDFIELPSLKLQKGLRSWFKVDPEFTRTWQPDGMNFSTRIRALTTKVKAIPALSFQVFDPAAGTYTMLETTPIPVIIDPQDGKDYFDTSELLDTSSNLTPQEAGIWNNRGKADMHNLLEYLLSVTTQYFWLLLAFGPVAFAIALPKVLEARRRELNPVYRAQHDAYMEFLAQPEKDIRKWHALKKLLAVSLGAGPGSWTVGDSTDKLPASGLDDETIQFIRQCHLAEDAGEFSRGGRSASMPLLKDVGKACFKALRKLTLVAMAGLLLMPGKLRADDWQHADEAFAAALLTEPGSAPYYAAFTESALKYESLAASGKRPGLAWYNAGNAWFFSGEIGRAIACYKQARIYRPFDPLIRENLKSTRALAVDVVDSLDRPAWSSWPLRWVALILILSALLFWALLLAYVRYRSRRVLVATLTVATAFTSLAALTSYNSLIRDPEGVIIVPEVYARKGPGYTYQTAFHEPLHDGLEFQLMEARDAWLQIRLSDGRSCWIPKSQAEIIRSTIQ